MGNTLMAVLVLVFWIAVAFQPLGEVWSRPTLMGWVLAGGWAIGLLGALLLAIVRPDVLLALISPKSRR